MKNWIRQNLLVSLVMVAIAAGLIFSIAGRGQTEQIKVQGVERTNQALKSANKALVSLRGQIIRGCERNNDRVVENNRRAVLHNEQNKAIKEIADTAREARLKAYEKEGGEFNLQAADTYKLVSNTVSMLKFKAFREVNCAREYPAIPALPPVE